MPFVGSTQKYIGSRLGYTAEGINISEKKNISNHHMISQKMTYLLWQHLPIFELQNYGYI